MTVPTGWEELSAAELWARAIRVPRADVAFWKHLYESFEDIAIVRTALNVEEDAIIAIIAPPDFITDAEAVYRDVLDRGMRADPAPLPAACREDWFLTEWAHA